jgi:hypothetical protein
MTNALRVPDHYIVLLKPTAVPQKAAILGNSKMRLADPQAFAKADQDGRVSNSLLANKMVAGTDAKVEWVLGPTVPGFIVNAGSAALTKLRSDPNVEAIIADEEIPNAIATVQSPTANWGLDRIDQHTLPLDNSFSYGLDGTGVHIYIMDSGIRTTHVDFGWRATNDANFVPDGNGNTDCLGHGTEVASIAGGSVYGVAKGARLHSVRNVGCGGGSDKAWVLSSLDWLQSYAYWGSVINISQIWTTGCSNAGPTFCNATARYLDGIESVSNIVLSAGNDGQGAATFDSWPARYGGHAGSPGTGATITVGATTKSDRLWSGSNRQHWVHMFAPGDLVKTAARGSDTATQSSDSGTSLAAPFVAGALALWRQLNPDANSTWAMYEFETVYSTHDVLVGSVGNAANRMLYIGGLQTSGGGGPGNPPPPPPNAPYYSIPITNYLLSSIGNPDQGSRGAVVAAR